MIHLRLTGGLGNQLFQILASRLVSEYLSQPLSVSLSALSKYQTAREATSLQLFSRIDFRTDEIASYGFIALSNKLRLGRISWLPFSINDANINCKIAKFSQSTVFPDFLQKNGIPILMDGYFQQCFTYDQFYSALRLLWFKPPRISVEHSNIVKDRVAIHLRGSDFFADSNLNIVNVDFYLRSIRLAIIDGHRDFFIVSDDLVFAAEIREKIISSFYGIRVSILSTGTAVGDFDLLRAASFKIVGNSTFSWWASALSDSGKIWSISRFSKIHAKPFTLKNEVFVL